MILELLRHRNDAFHHLNKVIPHVKKMNPHEPCARRRNSGRHKNFEYLMPLKERRASPVTDAMRRQIGTESTPNDARPPEQLAVPFDRGERA